MSHSKQVDSWNMMKADIKKLTLAPPTKYLQQSTEFQLTG